MARITAARGEIEYSPTPIQLRALEFPHPEVSFGGARGGGKTEAGIYFIWQVHDHPRTGAEDFEEARDPEFTPLSPGTRLRIGAHGLLLPL